MKYLTLAYVLALLTVPAPLSQAESSISGNLESDGQQEGAGDAHVAPAAILPVREYDSCDVGGIFPAFGFVGDKTKAQACALQKVTELAVADCQKAGLSLDGASVSVTYSYNHWNEGGVASNVEMANLSAKCISAAR